MPPETQQAREDMKTELRQEMEQAKEEFRRVIQDTIAEHTHDGVLSKQVNYDELFGESPSQINLETETITTTGNTDGYIIVPINGRLTEADFSGTDALAASDTNFITFSIVNLGQAGSGSTNLLSTGDENTTKATGGTALSADTVRNLTISVTFNTIQRGDRLRVRAAVTETLANAVTNPVYLLRFS